MSTANTSASRCLLLGNGCAMGRFVHPQQGHVLVALNSTAEFVLLRMGDRETVHLTRFVGSVCEAAVRQLLVFRNAHSTKPYICARFPSQSSALVTALLAELRETHASHFSSTSDASLISSRVLWARGAPLVTSSGWRVHLSLDGAAAILMCPSNRRVFARLPAFFDKEDVCERGAGYLPLEVTSVDLCYSTGCLPPDLAQLIDTLHNSSDNGSGDTSGGEVSTDALLCGKCGASDAKRATDELDSLKVSLGQLCDDEAYPITQATLVHSYAHITYTAYSPSSSSNEPCHVVDAWLSESVSSVLSLDRDVVDLREGPSRSSLHLALLRSVSGYSEDDMPAHLVPCQRVKQHSTTIARMLCFRSALVASIQCSLVTQPRPLGVVPPPRIRPGVGVQVFKCGEDRFSTISGGGAITYQGRFVSRLILKFSPSTKQLDVTDGDGQVARYHPPLTPASSSHILRECFRKLEAFIHWFNLDSSDRDTVSRRAALGSALASRSIFEYEHRAVMERLSNGESNSVEDCVRASQKLLPRGKLVAGGSGGEVSRDAIQRQLKLCSSFLEQSFKTVKS